jgi:5,10-methylenetetrahydrofolate reductase
MKLHKKLDAGAEFIQTLDIFDLDMAMRFFEQQRSYGVKLLAGLRLITQEDLNMSEEGRLPGNPVPEDMREELGTLTDSGSLIEKGVTRLIENIVRLKRSGLCDGVHLTADRHEDLIPRILQEAGL